MTRSEAGADDAVEQAQAARRAFVQARGNDLISEATGGAEAVRQRFEAAWPRRSTATARTWR